MERLGEAIRFAGKRLTPIQPRSLSAASGGPRSAGTPRSAQSVVFLNRRAFAITETELKLIAALAIIGLRSTPNHG